GVRLLGVLFRGGVVLAALCGAAGGQERLGVGARGGDVLEQLGRRVLGGREDDAHQFRLFRQLLGGVEVGLLQLRPRLLGRGPRVRQVGLGRGGGRGGRRPDHAGQRGGGDRDRPRRRRRLRRGVGRAAQPPRHVLELRAVGRREVLLARGDLLEQVVGVGES